MGRANKLIGILQFGISYQKTIFSYNYPSAGVTGNKWIPDIILRRVPWVATRSIYEVENVPDHGFDHVGQPCHDEDRQRPA